jgi:coenzyme F420-reducing hydrogenase gamma subunit
MSLPKVAVHKFSSCDGCQLAFLNMGEDLLVLSQQVELVHFAEAGPFNEEAEVDIAFVEGSISASHDIERIQKIRARSRFVVTIGACATSGGLQALKNLTEQDWTSAIYAQPEYIDSLKKVSPVADHIKVDLELWGCPVNQKQVAAAVQSLLQGAVPAVEQEKVCMDCKRSQNICVMVTRGEPCMGPVTVTGCGAICPEYQRACYACYGPAENLNSEALANRFEGLGLVPAEIARHFQLIHSNASGFDIEGKKWANKTQGSKA